MIAIKALVIALVVKMLWQPMMIYFFEGAGPLWATSLGFILATVYMGYHLYYQTLFNLKKSRYSISKSNGNFIGYADCKFLNSSRIKTNH